MVVAVVATTHAALATHPKQIARKRRKKEEKVVSEKRGKKVEKNEEEGEGRRKTGK